MTATTIDSGQFLHVRVLIGIILGLGIANLLTRLAGIVQHPGQKKVFWIHLGWVFSTPLALIHFWWWEFELRNVPVWTFELYFFVACYTTLYYLLCALLFPRNMDEYRGFEDYFLSRRKWFFGILALIYAADFLDTLVKGEGISAGSGWNTRSAISSISCSVSSPCVGGICAFRRHFSSSICSIKSPG